MAPESGAERMEPSVEPVSTLKRPYKSYKKKFLKLRHAFRDRMRDSNALYEDEQRAKQIARRLQEQNDQLLELLLDVNDCAKIPLHLKHDLRSPPPSATEVPELEPDDVPASLEEIQQAEAALREARSDFESGQIDPADYEDTEAAITAMITKGRSLATLSKTSHSHVQDVGPELMPDLYGDTPTGYLTPLHAEEYLSGLDTYFHVTGPDNPPVPMRVKPNERDREREVQLRNPMSVQNWLANHRPKELMVEDDAAGAEKPAKTPRKSPPKPSTSTSNPNRGNTKREKPGALLPKAEEEVLDEDGSVVAGVSEEAGGPQKKRKRGQDDDNAYRPKGGSNKKRKRAGTKGSSAGGGVEATSAA